MGEVPALRKVPISEVCIDLESNDALHLCVSSKIYDKYIYACCLSQELISNIYEEYNKYCKKLGKTADMNLKIKKAETITGPNDISISNFMKLPQNIPKQSMSNIYNHNCDFYELQNSLDQTKPMIPIYKASFNKADLDANNLYNMYKDFN